MEQAQPQAQAQVQPLAAGLAPVRVPHIDQSVLWQRLTDSWVPFAGLTLLAFAMRMIDLGARAMHHDESLHALYSWYLFVGRGYTHDPMMHGPFLFHFTALLY